MTTQTIDPKPLPSVGTPTETLDVLVIGSGMGALSAACMLARDGLKVRVLEQNYLPGGCTSTYPRQGYLFETGATTMLGLEDFMPPAMLFREIGLDFRPVKLETPMRVVLGDGTEITRHQNLRRWIMEAERVFGPRGQREFWEFNHKLSKRVWDASSRHLSFPPGRARDVLDSLKAVRPGDFSCLPHAFRVVEDVLRRFGLQKNERFRAFVDEQLMITAQNDMTQVNALFGAAALCYTNYDNYYVPGGNIELIRALVNYLESKGARLETRTRVLDIRANESRGGGRFTVTAEYRGRRMNYRAKRIVSGIPVNNTLELLDDHLRMQCRNLRLMKSGELTGAFTMGIGFRRRERFDVLHHQIHLDKPLPGAGAHSFFISLSHPDDPSRGPGGTVTANISAHYQDPARETHMDKQILEEAILNKLTDLGMFAREDLLYTHCSAPPAWEKWTLRKYGAVGGYHQYRRIKPWALLRTRLGPEGFYQCGDTTYPGQGIPGACLSGLIAHRKLMGDLRAENRRGGKPGGGAPARRQEEAREPAKVRSYHAASVAEETPR